MKSILPQKEYLCNANAFLVFVVFIFSTQFIDAQTKVLANSVTFQNHVENADNALLDDNTSATSNSYGGVVVGVGNYSGELELGFPTMIPANTTTYVKIDMDIDLLNALLGGSLGTLLGDVIGTVIFGNHYFNIEARNGPATVLSYSCDIPPYDRKFRIVQDAAGDFYIAITPDFDYDRIYIEDNTDALLVGTYNSMEVFNAFYFTDNQCNIDPLFTDYDGNGITLDIINIGGAGVTNPEHIIDEDVETYSEISLGVIGVLASMEQNVYFPAPYSPVEEFSITLKTNPTLVTLGILNNVDVKAFNGATEVYTTDLYSILSMDLLTLLQNGEEATVVFAPGVSFDRITIGLRSLLNVNIAQSLDVFEISVVGPPTPTTGDDTQEFCAIDNPIISDIQVNEANIIWYDAPIDGNQLDPNLSLVDGIEYYAAHFLNGCESDMRLVITVAINNTATPTTTNSDQEFCVVNEPTIADLQATGPNIVWYDAPTNGTAYTSSDPLIDGQTYYSTATDSSGCESSERLSVNITINDTATPTTTNTDQEFCLVNEPTITDLQATGPNIVWYDAPTNGTPYVSSDSLIDGQSYYAAATDTSGCESSVRLAVNVTIEDTATPTTTNTDQDFCLVDEPTVADLEATGPNIVWYDAPTNGTAYASSDSLIDGQYYYAAATDSSGCESSVRLAVNVEIKDTATPTTTNNDQEFCLVDEPTVADLEATGPNIVWYDAPTNGTAYASSDSLIDSQTYYAAATDTSGCESSVRLAVNVTIEDTATPTTTNTDQEFCVVDEPTVADLEATGPNVVWYDAPSGGTPYATGDLLIDGETYYAAATDTSGCESSVRLAVIIEIKNTATPATTNSDQEFCLINEPTIADLQATGPNIVWYDAPYSGTPYAPYDSLIDGQTYYAAATDVSGCESSVRLAVNVTIEDTAMPTTTNTNQEFCVVDEPTVADLQTTGPNVVWYDAPIGGTPFASTDSLIDGQTYYASATDTNGCESSVRLAVNVTTNDTATPITSNNVQVFCVEDNPTIVNLETTGPNVVWYNAPSGGTPYANSDLLIDGQTYYATATNTSGCESSERLVVNVIINASIEATLVSNGPGNVCLDTSTIYSTEHGNNNYIWNFVGGDLVNGGGPNDDYIEIFWTTTTDTWLSVSYDSVSSCISGDIVTFVESVIVCADITIDITVSDLEPIVGDNVDFTIEVSNSGPNEFTTLEIQEQLPSGYDFIDYNVSVGDYSHVSGVWNIDVLLPNDTVILTITAEVLDNGDYLNIATILNSDPIDSDTSNNSAEVATIPVCLTVYNQFSPNGDGVNDQFVINCIENWPDNSLKVFNRYGSLIYEKNSYDNSWSGHANVDNTKGKDEILPSDTYFYVLEMGDREKSKTGWLFIVK
ncbi:Ig-like domain-containing protein [Ulvibacter antarcticus]|uniref:Putative repeat protein (TIGR01451 family)/gliding motility-associated-like protein n=1 Tax=Ulvibacter antarcticus TaxID=442714 RepID=A0A3L9YHA4_9FLAO|nr:gliding motility-associated C-terminal domain-containing protein [Ulvibacter antarcticus]RMA58850.1 putative repeat protein (TIGR01451 family)/gliding motility-associated-like protein [Ulvibacter antarcticus]